MLLLGCFCSFRTLETSLSSEINASGYLTLLVLNYRFHLQET